MALTQTSIIICFYFKHMLRPKNTLCFGQPDLPIGTGPADPRLFFVGIFIIEVSILKKQTKNGADPI